MNVSTVASFLIIVLLLVLSKVMRKCTSTKWLTDWPTPWSRVLLMKLTVTQLVKKFSTFKEHESSLMCSQESKIGLYSEAGEFSSHLSTQFFKDPV
jgi:hypothetical protein